MTGQRRAEVETTHADAALVAAALRPDNTESMTTDVDAEGGPSESRTESGGLVRTVIERETTGGLQATVDDYVVNLTVADAVTATAREFVDNTNHE